MVIPAFNEAETIREVVVRAMRHADVCVVDDASTDETGEIVAGIPGAHTVRHERNTHIATGILDGMRFAASRGYSRVVTMDAGLSHDPDEIPSLLAPEDADVVLGVRTRVENVPVSRRILSRMGTLVVNRIAAGSVWRGVGLSDATSGYRAYSDRALECLLASPVRSRAFAFHLEALSILHRAGMRIVEVPIEYRFTNSSLSGRVVREAISVGAQLWKENVFGSTPPGVGKGRR